MKRALFFTLAMVFAAASLAQQYKWVDKNGRTQYGDTPPPGVKATRLGGAGSPAAPSSAAKDAPPSAAAKDAKGAPKGPLTPAQQDAEFRKRQQEAEKAREKEAKAGEETQAKRENCAVSQEALRVLESGQRVARTDAAGERYYIDDEQRKADVAKARKNVQEWCG